MSEELSEEPVSEGFVSKFTHENPNIPDLRVRAEKENASNIHMNNACIDEAENTSNIVSDNACLWSAD